LARGARRINDGVEAFVLAVGLDVRLQVRRGVAPAGSVLAAVSIRTLHAGADQARGRSAGSGAPRGQGQEQGAIERHPG
jgi:hypothetical protein